MNTWIAEQSPFFESWRLNSAIAKFHETGYFVFFEIQLPILLCFV